MDKILQIVCTYPPYKGGIGNVAKEFANRLKERGYNSAVLTPKYTEVKDENNIIRLTPFIKYGNSAFLLGMSKILDKYDIIHLHWPFFGVIESLAFYLLRNPEKKFFITYHMDFWSDNIVKKIASIPSFILLPYLLKRSQKITCSSFDYLEHSQIASFYKKNKDKFVEIPFGANEIFVPKKISIDFYKKYNIPKNKKIILFVGGLDRAHIFKGVEILLKSYAKLSNKLKQNTVLVIIGEGDLKIKYQNLAKNLSLSKEVFFLGGLSSQKLVDIYNNSYVLVLPSLNSAEAFGIVLVEASACKLPSITSNLAGVRSVIKNNYNGLLIKPGDINDLVEKLEIILSDLKLRNQLAKNAYDKYVSNYRWNVIIDKLEKLYQS